MLYSTFTWYFPKAVILIPSLVNNFRYTCGIENLNFPLVWFSKTFSKYKFFEMDLDNEVAKFYQTASRIKEIF